MIDNAALVQNLPKVWVLTTGEAGMRSQAVGLAERLGWDFEEKHVPRHRWLSFLPANIPQAALLSLTHQADRLTKPWPDIVISCGRRSAALAVAIRKKSGGASFTIHIQNPQCDLAAFDVVIPPRHDGVDGANCMISELALHGLTPAIIKQAAVKFAPYFAPLPRPLIGVLLGGPSGSHQMNLAAMVEFGQILSCLINQGFGIMLSFSRRTPTDVKNKLETLLAQQQGKILFYDPAANSLQPQNSTATMENPYRAILGLSDFLIVSEDSVSMLSEATISGKPIYRLAMAGGGRRHRHFIAMAEQAGYVRPLPPLAAWQAGQKLDLWSYQIPDDAGRIAERIRALPRLQKYFSPRLT